MNNNDVVNNALKTRYRQEHIDKRAKCLISDSSSLGLNAKNDLVASCLENLKDAPEASVILSSLIAGRSPVEIINNVTFKEYSKHNVKTEYPCLQIKLEYGYSLWIVISDELPPDYNEGLFIVLPHFLTEGLKEAQKLTSISTRIQQFLSSLDTGSRRYTESKISTYLDYNRFEYSISAAELMVIKNTEIKNCVNAQYGQMNIGVIQKKLNDYIAGTILEISSESFHQPTPILLKTNFGSRYTPTDEVVSNLFTTLANCIKKTKVINNEDIQRQFNLITIYVVMYLTICTMHRPDKNAFGFIGNFNLADGFLLIDDKQDFKRIIGLPKSASLFLKDYLVFIKKNLSIYSMSNFGAALTLQRMFDNEEPIFHLFNNQGALEPFSYKFALTLISNENSELSTLKSNWARHWVCTKLYLLGMNRDLIARVMGHKNESEYTNPYSVCSIDELTKVASAIEEHLVGKILNLQSLKELV